MSPQTSEAGTVLRLAPNTPQRFYRGGERILAFRGLAVPNSFDGRRPEDGRPPPHGCSPRVATD